VAVTLARRPLGASGLEVSAVGLGCGALGESRVSDEEADALVGRALELGITVFDTARSYGSSEERLGHLLRRRRDDVVLVTKGGYGIAEAPDWTGDAVRLGIDRALTRLATDRLDAFFLHSCPMGTLVRDEILDELDRAKDAGKIRLRGYSGENEELLWAVRSGRFDVVECSVSVFDHGSLGSAVAEASARGIGVLAKRPLANAPWRFAEEPAAPDVREAWLRARAMAIDPRPLTMPELSIRFAAFAPGVSTALVGTSSVSHLEEAVRAAEGGPLDGDARQRVEDAWKMHASAAWRGIV